MNITLKHPNPDTLEYFQQVTMLLNLEEKLDEINAEYFRTGKAFVNLNILCDICEGSSITKENTVCNHPEGTFQSILVLNSDWITPSGKGYSIIAHDELYEQAQNNDSDLPARVIEAILQTGQIPLSNRTLVVIDSLAGSEFVEHVFKLTAEMQGFTEDAETYIFPKVTVEWDFEED